MQTEEHGLHGPKIQTLIHFGGEILNSVQSDCSDLMKNSLELERGIMARMEEQHKRVVLILSAEVAVKLVSSDQKMVELVFGRTEAGLFDCSIGLHPIQPKRSRRCSIVVSCVAEYGDDALRASVSA
jgi:hypothetical protein